MQSPHHVTVKSRRDFLLRAGSGFGGVALAHLLTHSGGASLRAARAASPNSNAAAAFAARSPHIRARAKRVIFLFMDGGPSHIDTFDYKPEVNRFAGQSLPPSIPRPYLPMGETDSPILASQRTWRRYGKSGILVSDWMPHVGRMIDDIAVIRSCQSDGIVHLRGVSMLNTGSVEAGRPSLGAWTVYGLGTESQDLPAFVVLTDRRQQPPGGVRNWGTGFMPPTFQGTVFHDGPKPILNLRRYAQSELAQQRRKLDLIAGFNRLHAAKKPRPHARCMAWMIAARPAMVACVCWRDGSWSVGFALCSSITVREAIGTLMKSWRKTTADVACRATSPSPAS